MAEVKWIKLTTDMFDNRKIKHLRKLPEGNSIVLIWVMLLTMAGRCNAGGMIFLTENIPYTPKMLADELGFEENTVKLALEALERFNMIVTDNGFFAIAGWEEHQNTDRLAEIREYNRLAKQRSRAKQKALQAPKENVIDASMTSQPCHETDIEEDKDKEADIENIYSDEAAPPKPKKKKAEKQKYCEFHNVLLTKEEYAKLEADFGNLYTVKAISFLDAYIEEKGYKSKSHNMAIRRWVMDAVKEKEAKPQRYGGRKEKVPGWFQQYEMGDAEQNAIRKMMGLPPEDHSETEEAKQLRAELEALSGRK